MTISKPMNTPSISKRSLSAHAWLGLFVSAFMYIICLSGTLAVFHQELERWEQPQVPETALVDIPAIEKAYDSFVETYPEETDHMYIVFPGSGIPRVVVENDHVAHFMNTDGTLGEVEQSNWTKMLVDLHLYLHLPKSFGMILVSAFGALLCALILSGFIAHPRIIKDAFRFRRGGTGLQENIDLHNRFSVWAAPFHLMIGVTGAYFGLATILIAIVSQAFYAGDNQAVIDEIFTPEPSLEQPLQRPQIGNAIEYIQQNAPEGELLFLTVHEPNTSGQFIEAYVKEPGRLIYSENYRFDVQGNFLDTSNYRDGDTAKQVVYSMYRLHFGEFAGIASKLLYFVLGMMLTVVSATGINIWLLKRKTTDVLNQWWPTLVWGIPVMLTLSALFNLFVDIRIDLSIWLGLVVALAIATRQQNIRLWVNRLKQTLAILLILFIVLYTVKFGLAGFSLPALQINIPLAFFAAYLLFKGPKQTEQV
ncbi:PepSY-associated TM helix domain-containing protein [Paraglaciecola sp. 20A4]|uniref:PepSY-associated TM helix domain-containing protein n=1 Tax=Paraglaciecola sp. 20A4 TaxID=2687288 RepID=UPI001408CCDC|nr:PepSY-associated TM helix domain-containing protein [Paraglaciecola sp. 20A4]